ncbi:hypothetical protein KR059_006335, partial [Drosophila kikkawai]
EEDLKPEIRNADLMWSATAGCNNATNISTNGNNSAASSYSETSAMAFAEVSGSTNPYSTYQRQQSQTQQGQTQQQQESTDDQFPVVIKQEQVDMDYVYAEKRRRLSGGSDKKSQSEAQNEDQLIPPGGSLLRKRNPPMMTSLSSTRKVSELKNRKIQRPDTPHSLNDEVAAPEFRHNVDLRACVMGSNNISLTSDVDVSSISQINGYLQNAAKGLFPARFPINDMNDVLDVLNQEVQSQSKQTQQQQQQQAAIDKGVSTVASPPTTSSDCDSDDGESNHYARLRRNQSSKIINNSYSMMLHSDHSYTRCNEMVDDGPNIETPSDSDEEIDVVSYTDKKLPNNPSCQIMGALQTKMAHKISVDQKKPRYGNYNLPYTPASSSPVKSVANSRYPSPSSTPYQNCSSASQSYSPLSVESSSSSSSSSSTSSISSGLVANTTQKGRKHYYLNVASDGIGSRRIMQSSSSMLSKKCRGKKASSGAAAAVRAATAANISSSSSSSSCSGSISPVAQSQQQSSSLAAHNWQRQSSSTSSSGLANSGRNNNQFSLDEADTIEKRNQHNDMERQRRIGLKNLFEALKKQIPTIRDKERAPKVNILREAAKLCEQLTREEQELSLQRQMLKEKLKQQQELLARFRLAKSEPLEANS